jgi:N-acyl-D-aspartate/D-glutamate deacylase
LTTLLVLGGRVVDPAAGFDGVADVLVENGKVAAVGTGLEARAGDATRLDAAGMVVGPGFVDLHSHVHSIAGQRLQAMDGVTTSLDLEAGVMPVDLGYKKAADEGRPLNYGFSASWAQARGQVLAGVHPEGDLLKALGLVANESWQRSSTREELAQWIGLLRGEIEAGALGVGILVGYAPRTEPAEYLEVARLAAEAGVATFTHVRELTEADPTTPIDGPSEVAIAASETGARMHHCHVNSTSRRHVDRVLATLADAQSRGAPVTLEAYPYGAGSTAVGAFFLAPERLPAWGIGPSSIVLLPSGERIADERRLREVREKAPDSECIVEFLDEENPSDWELLQRALVYPDAIVASDAMPLQLPGGERDTHAWPLPPGGSTHPRTAGTFSKALRVMVRETGRWTWLEAFRRCSYLPARVLDFAPAAAGKGSLAVGADADIVVIDPDRVGDRATYGEPTVPSTGVKHLLVNGEPVVLDGELVVGAFPGRPLRASPK